MMKIICYIISFFMVSSCWCAEQDSQTPGLWLLPRMDSTNKARSDIAGNMTSAPEEVWRMATGGAVGYARNVTLNDNKEAALILVGNNLELKQWDGHTIWRLTRDNVRGIMHLGDFNGDGKKEVMVLCSTRDVTLYDLETGKKLWTWQAPQSSAILRSQFYKTNRGIRFITFPTYSVKGFCFDFSDSITEPELLWEKDYSGTYTTGYGPTIILKDMDDDSELDIVLSSKYCEHSEGKTCCHAVIDIDTGEIKYASFSVPDSEAPLDLGRPYGLLRAVDLDSDRFPEVVMVSCQVEEYIELAQNIGGHRLEKKWGKFIEKDWPVDDRELRPQITSLSDVRGNGKIELIIGLWDNDEWNTLIIDPLEGFTARRACLTGFYFWGCHDVTGDTIPEIIASTETRREPAHITTLHALDGTTLEPVATLENAAVFLSTDSDLPADVGFKALRRNPVPVTRKDGIVGILIRRFRNGTEIGVYLWGGKSGSEINAHNIAGERFVRIDKHGDYLLLTDRTGCIQRFDENLNRAEKKLETVGRSCQPLVWTVGHTRELVIPMAGGIITGGKPDLSHRSGLIGRWEVPGSMPALHTDRNGVSRLSVSDMSDPDNPAVVIYRAPINATTQPFRIPLSNKPYIGIVPSGDEFRLLVNLQTGVHTNAFVCFDVMGNLMWESPDHGAHPRLPAVADLVGDSVPEVIADDHGEVRVYDSISGKLICGDYGKRFIPPVYVLPIVDRFKPDGEKCILGISGFGGISLRNADAEIVWKLGEDEYRYYWGLGAVGDVDGSGRLKLGIMTEDSMLECIDIEKGSVLWSVDLKCNSGVGSVIAGDVDENGRDEFTAGLPDGRLVTVGEIGNKGVILWEKHFDAAVAHTIMADVDGDGSAEIVLSTTDGYVRILR